MDSHWGVITARNDLVFIYVEAFNDGHKFHIQTSIKRCGLPRMSKTHKFDDV